MRFLVTGEESADRAAAFIRSMGNRALNMSPALRAVSEIVTEGMAENFDSEGVYLGDPWPPLKPSTLKKKASAGRTRFLVWKGDLEGATKDPDVSVSDHGVRIAVHDDAVGYISFGRAGGKGGEMPPRNLVGIAPQAWPQINRVLSGYIVTGHHSRRQARNALGRFSGGFA